MWISRKKYNDMVEELECLREYAEIFEDVLRNASKKTPEEIIKLEVEKITKEEEQAEARDVLERILNADTQTRTKLCDEIGISHKTLRNFLSGEKVKPVTHQKIRKYIYNEQGQVKKEVLDKISKTTRQEQKTV